jgi:hypothetical protein
MKGARAFQASVSLLAVVFLAFHLPYLPSSLEDLDSINFALGIRHFDVGRHQPHPPGYPVFILIAKAAHAVVPSEARALGLLSAVAGALGVLAIGLLFRRLDRDASPNGWTLTATGVAMTAPLYWFTAVRPLSDMTGLAAALAAQAMTLAAGTRREFAVAAFSAGLATGLRSQAAWLTLPLLIVRGLGAGSWGLGRGWGLGREPAPPAPSPKPLVPVAAAFAAGVLSWFVPLIVITGGPAAYWRALSNQGAEDLGNISMLWTTHTVRALTDALYYAFIAPWAAWPVAVVMLVTAAAGMLWAARHNRVALATIAAAFGPYAIFDLLFQETFTSRYALPLVVPIAYLAVLGLRWMPWETGIAAAIAIAMFDAHMAGRSIAAYSRQKAPAFRLLDDMASEARTVPPPVLAMDRKNAFDFRRPIVWANGSMPRFTAQLPAPPQHEWLEPVTYWNGGGRAPVWFVVDPKRTAIDLVQHGEPVQYRWPLAYPALLSGARPDEMDWYRVDRPEWYVGEGWSLTPESAGVADADRRGLQSGPIRGWMQGTATEMMIGGRNFESHPVNLTMTLADGKFFYGTAGGGHWTRAWQVAPGPFVNFFRPMHGPGDVPDYVSVDIAATPPGRVAIEQFDASVQRSIFGFGLGWHEQEFNPRTGLRWRWLSERGELKVRAPAGGASLHIEGESPRTYFSRGSHLIIQADGRPVFDRVLDDDFSLDVPIENAADTIVLETDQTYVPADRSRRTQDRRHLGLRIFKCEIRRALP